MTELRKYKHAVAVILLTVYAFIATPVQFWHHQNYQGKNTSSLQPDGGAAKITAPDADNKTIGDNCQICSHHYSIYSNDAIPAFEIFISDTNSKKWFNIPTILLAPFFNFTNKGPPAVA